MDKGLRQHMIRRARQLRQDQTHPERVLWYALRSRRLEGFKFRRQRPMGRYVVDFVCLEHKLIIEFDGDSLVDEGVNGLDDQDPIWLDKRNGIDDIGEPETRPPYDIPLRGIEVRIRQIEVSTGQVRQVSVVGDFTN